MRGRQLFFSEAGCANCHSGPLLSNQKFYALDLPAFGPGRTISWDPSARDVRRMGESDDLRDAYRFKTTRLRNITLTRPDGNNGAYQTLEGRLYHHLKPHSMRAAWTRDMAALPSVLWLKDIDLSSNQIVMRSRDKLRKLILNLAS